MNVQQGLQCACIFPVASLLMMLPGMSAGLNDIAAKALDATSP
jgi:hypothetical protein